MQQSKHRAPLASPKHGEGESQRAPARNSHPTLKHPFAQHFIASYYQSHVASISTANNCYSCCSYTQNCCKKSFVSNVVRHPGPGRRVSIVRQEGCEKTTAQPPLYAAIGSRPASMSVFRSCAISTIVKLTFCKPSMLQTCSCPCPSIKMLVRLASSCPCPLAR
jgi:hypothetical protein